MRHGTRACARIDEDDASLLPSADVLPKHGADSFMPDGDDVRDPQAGEGAADTRKKTSKRCCAEEAAPLRRDAVGGHSRRVG